MTPRAIQAAIDILTRWEANGETADRMIASEFRARRYLNSTERRDISEQIYSAIRYRRRIQWTLDQMKIPVCPETSLKIVREWDEREDMLLPGVDNPFDHIRITLSFPDKMAESLITLLGAEEAISAASAFNKRAPTTLRINPLRTRREQILSILPDASPCTFSPWGINLPQGKQIPSPSNRQKGWWEIQEEASQLTALLADPRPGERVVDLGAGAGGKTLVLAALMENQGRITAVDKDCLRLEKLRERASRAGVSCIDTAAADVESTEFWKQTASSHRTLDNSRESADCVIVDAPCSGSGVIRRSPDARWREWNVNKLNSLQLNMLTKGAELTVDGGRLIYITCAFETEQDEMIIDQFLNSRVGARFNLEPALPLLLESIRRAADKCSFRDDIVDDLASERLGAGYYIRTWPHRSGLDAFFAAYLRKGNM